MPVVSKEKPVRAKITRQAWTLICQKQEGETLNVRPVVVLGTSFINAARKAANWQTANSEWTIASLTLQQDTVI